MQLQKLPVFALQIAKILEKHIVFQGFFCPQHFSPQIMRNRDKKDFLRFFSSI